VTARRCPSVDVTRRDCSAPRRRLYIRVPPESTKHRRTYQRLCKEIEAATDVAFFGGLEVSADGPEAEGRATTGTNQNEDAVRGQSRRRRQA